MVSDDLVPDVDVTVPRVDGVGDGRHAMSMPPDRADGGRTMRLALANGMAATRHRAARGRPGAGMQRPPQDANCRETEAVRS